MKEEWKRITGFDNFWISTKGRVYNTKGKGGFVNGTVSNGFVMITITENNKVYKGTLAKLVANEFIENKNGYKYALHKDGDKFNNSASNIYWSKSTTGRVKAEYKYPCDTNETMTIQEFRDKYNLPITTLAKALGVVKEYIEEHLEGERPFTKSRVERLRKLGFIIDDNVGLRKNSKPEKPKPKKIKSHIVKDFHLAAMKRYGNTIVSKKNSPQQIIDEFKKYGFDVDVRDFKHKKETHSFVSLGRVVLDEDLTHYVVSEIGRG